MKLDPKKTAIIVVDMLNDFVREKGRLVVPKATDLLFNQSRLLEMARHLGLRVMYLADNHEPDDDEFGKWPAHAVVGTWGSEIVDELKPEQSSEVIPKRRYSGFFGTDLDLRLREKGIVTMILVGVLTDICVMYTSADASARGYNVIVITDATASTSEENHLFALEHMRSVHGTTLLTTEEAIEALE
ncbi:MAG: cysteine hydrolase [Candidatus Thorarchaeota archaeon]|nr:cysteine hydrolase [Candidatus Thorarchaeota archaeon]